MHKSDGKNPFNSASKHSNVTSSSQNSGISLVSIDLVLARTASCALDTSQVRANAAEAGLAPAFPPSPAPALDSQNPLPASEAELPPGQKSLDLVRAERTAWRLAHLDFPWDINKALEFALLRTFAVPSISGLLDRTGEFANRPLKRYDDTTLLIREVLSNGLDSDRARRAFSRINAMHGRFRIANGDFLYVLSTFVFSPIDWLDSFGRRGMTEDERDAWFLYWREFGRRMGIADLPADLRAFRDFAIAFERKRFAKSPSNRAVAQPTIDLLLRESFVPPFLYPAGRTFVMALCPPQLAETFGFPAPSRGLRLFAHGVMRFRRRILRLLPQRTRPKYIRFGDITYPEGYNIEELGTFARRSSAGTGRGS